MKILRTYDKEYDRLLVNFGGRVEHSRELEDINVIFDFNKNNEIVGFEIIDFMKSIKKSDEEIEKIFKKK